jgi:DNA-binding transcriptional ArsR family regulator
VGIYIPLVPRAATTADIFNAVAESQRRDILVYLAPRERHVSDIVAKFNVSQPSVSKHLKVLRHVGLVDVRRDGRQMFYRANADAIRPLQEWTGIFQQYWSHQLTRVKERAERNPKT